MTAVPQSRKRWWIAATLLAIAAGAGAYFAFAPSPAAALALSPEPAEATTEQVHQMCGACHAYPPPETFPRSAWRKEVKQAYDFFHDDPTYRFDVPHLEAVVRYYESRAPESLPLAPRTTTASPPVEFERKAFLHPIAGRPPGAAFVSIVRLTQANRPEILVCDAINNQVLLLTGDPKSPDWRPLARGLCCVHAEVVDLDSDGHRDVLLACIGSFYATDDRVGSVVWLRGQADGSFAPIVLRTGLGRVADVRAADFTGDGKLDLVVAEFGWHRTGSILLLENQTTDWSKPAFAPRVLDGRHGATHVPTADLNGDGKPDFVAVISQEHETVVAFLNEGGGRFRKETIYSAPHPTFGCNSVALADLDGDGDLDVVLSNGDSLDAPYLLRPDHGITWLENQGRFPFAPHRLADCCGAGSPVVADFDGNGLADVAFVSFLPGELFPQRSSLRLDAVVLMQQTTRGQFVRHVLETEQCDHLTCAAGDWDGDGKPDLAIGNYVRGGRPAPCVKVWRNLGRKP